jgi:hypothetical protein
MAQDSLAGDIETALRAAGDPRRAAGADAPAPFDEVVHRNGW